MKILARHKWLVGCTITESCDTAKSAKGKMAYRRFTATIRGWRNFVIYEGYCFVGMDRKIKEKVCEIRDKIDAGDESAFSENCRISRREVME